ncbi:MAG: RDD family protein [Candidatus Kapaibacteriales bacterium]
MRIKKDTVIVQSPQNVALEFKLASLGERILAYMVDILILLGFIIFTSITLSYIDDHYYISDLWYFFVIIIPVVTYDVYMEYLMNGQSPGKRAFRLRVVRADGERAELQHFALRWLFRVVEGIALYGIIPITSYILTDKHQRLGDLAAGTLVIKESKTLLETRIGVSRSTTYKPVFGNLDWMTEDDVDVVYHILLNIYSKESAKYLALKERLASKVRDKYNLPKQGEEGFMNSNQILQRLAAEYNHHKTFADAAPQSHFTTKQYYPELYPIDSVK